MLWLKKKKKKKKKTANMKINSQGYQNMFQMENEINRDYLEEKILTTKSLFFF